MNGKTAAVQPHQPKVLFLQNKNSIELSEDNLDAHYGDNSLIVMKNDFYNDDFYDYKDTFLGKLDSKHSHNNNKIVPNSNSNNKMVKIETGEDYEEEDDLCTPRTDDDDDDDEDIDYNNDFTTGPLAINKNSRDSEEESGYDNNNFDNENFVHFENGEYSDEFEDQGGLMGDTFFKRVDSLELCKPKKAKIVNNYLMGEVLGDGSYGKVKECIDLESLSRRAVKIINLKIIARKIPYGVENVRKEINIMKRLNHKNLIKLYDTYEKTAQTLQQEQIVQKNQNIEQVNNDDDLLAITSTIVNIEKPPKLYIFMDYCMTSLEKLIKTAPEQRLRNWQANHYFKQIIDGIEYLHSLNIIHNDIKPGNLLITCNDTLKICDFSISAELKIFYEYEYLKNKEEDENNNTNKNKKDNDYDSETEINPQLLMNNRNSSSSNRSRFPILQCTPMFQCPEMLDEDIDELMILKNAPKIDIWSTGITLFQLTTGQLPFQGQTIHQIFENIRATNYEIKIPAFIDKNLRELLNNMLNRDPIKRWSLKQIRDSEWFHKKHPYVQDDLANLPEDVIQNEYATFRMINYLEKLCQLKTVAELTSNDFSQFYDDIANQDDCGDQMANLNINTDKNNVSNEFHNVNNNVLASAQGQSSNMNKNNSVNKTNSVQTSQSQQNSKEYSQATKVKKSHCSLM